MLECVVLNLAPAICLRSHTLSENVSAGGRSSWPRPPTRRSCRCVRHSSDGMHVLDAKPPGVATVTPLSSYLPECP